MTGHAPKRLGLSRERRLVQREFGQAQRVGERVVNGCLIANWMKLPEQETSRVGVITSKRIGSAVVRNRARRLLRESFRLHQTELVCPVALVLVARPSITSKDFQGVERDFLTVMRRNRLIKAAG